MTEPVHQQPARRGLLPAEHYLDSGYPSTDMIVDSWRTFGIALVTPVLADTSAQARAGAGFDRSAFTIDFDRHPAICPHGQTSSSWTPASQRGIDTIVIKFAAATCVPCPVRGQCTTSKKRRRQLTVYPRDVYQAQHGARVAQTTTDWQADYALRACVEGSIRHGVAVTGLHHTRYPRPGQWEPEPGKLRDGHRRMDGTPTHPSTMPDQGPRGCNSPGRISYGRCRYARLLARPIRIVVAVFSSLLPG